MRSDAIHERHVDCWATTAMAKRGGGLDPAGAAPDDDDAMFWARARLI